MIKRHQSTYKYFAEKMPLLSPMITLMASFLLIFVFLGATSYLYIQTSPVDNYGQESTVAYRQALEEASQSELAQKEWKWLFRYHGYPAVVIYEEGKTPYFYDKQNNKCAFTYPLEETGPFNTPAENSRHDVALMLDQESQTEQ